MAVIIAIIVLGLPVLYLGWLTIKAIADVLWAMFGGE
jgi:hypothetical protein